METPNVQVIEPNRCWYRIPVREILRYRDLIWLFVRRDFVATYKQTVLGPLWHIISPLTNTAIYTIVFGNLAKLPTDGLPKPVFYLCGQLAWGYLSRCVSGTSGTLTGNAALFGKVYFPRLIVPLSQVLGGLIGYAIQVFTFLVVWSYARFFTGAGAALHMRPWLVLLPLMLVLSAAVGSGVGLWNSALTAKYRDFARVFGFLMNVWMWATPIVYPLSMVPSRWRWLSLLNPMTPVVEFYRFSLLGQGTIHPGYFASTVFWAVVLLFSGIFIFNRTERTFIDTV